MYLQQAQDTGRANTTLKFIRCWSALADYFLQYKNSAYFHIYNEEKQEPKWSLRKEAAHPENVLSPNLKTC